MTILSLAFAVLVMFSCKHDRNQPGYAYMPDMYYSVPYDAYTNNPVFNDSLTMQPPVPGTIPRGYMPYPYKPKSFDDQKRAGEELINPVPSSSETLARGKTEYDIYCASCHGLTGKGDGHLYITGKFTAKPAVLTDTIVQNKKDGELYHVITVGTLSGLMGPHGAQVAPTDRWMIINYVRELGKK